MAPSAAKDDVAPTPLRVFYVSQTHPSHARAALDYGQIISTHHEVVAEPEQADVAVFHIEPHAVAAALREYPALLGCHRIGYFVWEASDLPAAYVPVMRLVHEVWTPSQYCVNVFARHHAQVWKVPHVAARPPVSRDTATVVRQALGHDPAQLTLLAISKPADPRKNTAQILRVFPRVRAQLPNVRLIVKNLRPEPLERALASPGVTFVEQAIPDPEMTALLQMASVLVSAHHAEGWGFNVSDAMSLGVPVVATAYSGNLEFTSDETAFAIPATEEPIRPEDRFGLFDGSMKWGYVSDDALTDQLLAACRAVTEGRAAQRAARARQTVEAFSLPNVAAVTLERLSAVSARRR
ncbi:MAG: glycosyltransferase [Myxococcales bacterium]|nr:glycosyltransferase [Myxococcales bacterium]